MEIISESIRTSRSLTAELAPPVLHEAGLGAGLQWLSRWMKEKHGLEVILRTDPKASADREDVRVLVFEAVRELLFNVVKHAETLEAFVELAAFGSARLEVTVRDNGKGFNPDTIAGNTDAAGGGFGLFSLRERLALIGGHLEIDSAVGKGSRFTVIAPV